MTYPIEQRPSAAWEHVRDTLRSGLAAQITAINDDLTTRSKSWRVPELGGATPIWTTTAGILLRAQEPDLPSGLTYPQVRVVPGSLLSRQDTSGRGGLTSLGVSVAVYLDMQAVKRAQAAASITVGCDEEQLLLALADLASAVARTLRAPVGGVYDADSGIVQIEPNADAARAPQIHYVPAPDSRPSALWCGLEYRLTLEETY